MQAVGVTFWGLTYIWIHLILSYHPTYGEDWIARITHAFETLGYTSDIALVGNCELGIEF